MFWTCVAIACLVAPTHFEAVGVAPQQQAQKPSNEHQHADEKTFAVKKNNQGPIENFLEFGHNQQKDDLIQIKSILNKHRHQMSQQLSQLAPQPKVFTVEDNDSLPNLYRLVSTILSIQLANAFIERVFSLCKAQWTDARNCLQVETVKALLQVRVNFDIDCAGVYKLLIEDGELRKKIQEGEKWK